MSGLESLLIKAKSAAKRGETDAARAIYQEALDQYPRNKRLHAALRSLDAPPQGNAAQRQLDVMVDAYKAGRMEEAARHGAKLAGAFPHNYAVHNLQGAALLALGDLPAAEAASSKASTASATSTGRARCSPASKSWTWAAARSPSRRRAISAPCAGGASTCARRSIR